MGELVKHPALLSKSQLDYFRSQVAIKREAAFLAPQLLEQVAVLTRDLRSALAMLDALRAEVIELDGALGLGSGGAEHGCPRCSGDRVARALARLRALATEG